MSHLRLFPQGTGDKRARITTTHNSDGMQTRMSLPHALLAAVFLLAVGIIGWPSPAHSAMQERWIWPTGEVTVVTRAFDPPAMPWLSGHRGVDLGAPIGTIVVAPADGEVIFAGAIVDRQTVSVMHGGGLRSTYEPVIPLVRAGQKVTAGEPIATVEPGHSPGSLHWGARFGPNHYINPLRMLVGPSVLKPWE